MSDDHTQYILPECREAFLRIETQNATTQEILKGVNVAVTRLARSIDGNGQKGLRDRTTELEGRVGEAEKDISAGVAARWRGGRMAIAIIAVCISAIVGVVGMVVGLVNLYR